MKNRNYRGVLQTNGIQIKNYDYIKSLENREDLTEEQRAYSQYNLASQIILQLAAHGKKVELKYIRDMLDTVESYSTKHNAKKWKGWDRIIEEMYRKRRTAKEIKKLKKLMKQMV